MTTYPLSTLAAQATTSGISAPTYADVYASLQASYQSIFGSDVVLTPDSQDGQWLAILAQAINDSNQLAIAVYNSFSPVTAQGAGLSSVVKINGLRRLVPTNSTATMTIVGQNGTVITNGVVQDINKNKWDLPTTVTIPGSGTITVTATCETAGEIAANAGTITTIVNPQLGWQSATNPYAAVPGAPVEDDATLRQRQAVSTAQPASAILDGILASVANLTGVQRYAGYENPTNSTDANGLPPHSIAIVVEGGDVAAIASTIAKKKPPGITTYGTQTQTVLDAYGVPSVINFFLLGEVSIYANVTIKALTGYSGAVATQIKSSVASFIDALAIHSTSYLAWLYGPAGLNNAGPGLTYKVTNISQARSDMNVTAGPYSAGTTSLAVTNVANYATTGQASQIQIPLDDGSWLSTNITGIAGNTITFANAVPGGRQILAGSLVYVGSDLALGFTEGANCISSNINLVVT